MRLKGFLRAFFGGSNHPPAPPAVPIPSEFLKLSEQIAALTLRVEALDGLQVTREAEWAETRDKLLRWLKRSQELDSRQRRELETAAPRTALVSAVLQSKFPNGVNATNAIPPKNGE